MKSFKLTALLLSSSITFPFLYLLGFCYQYGYLTALGVPADIYPQSIENTFVTAFMYLYANWWQSLLLIAAGIFAYALILMFMVQKRPDIQDNPGKFVLAMWVISDWYHKYKDEETRWLISAAVVLVGVVWLGLVVLVFAAITIEDGKKDGFKRLAITKCMMTNKKGKLNFSAGQKVFLKGAKKPIDVYILHASDKFITYFSVDSKLGKRIETKPMGEVVSIIQQQDIFADDWGEDSKKKQECKAASTM